MKYLIIIPLLFASFPLIINSSEYNNNSENHEDLRLEAHHKYISYKFGIVDVYIAEGDTICDVLILRKGVSVSTTCPKSPILRWTFDVTDNEITDSPVIENNYYDPFYYKLSIVNDSSQTILSSSTLLIDYKDDVKEKIEELKAFIIKLCITNCVNENSSEP